MTEPRARQAADNTALLLGVVTIVSGAATGLFSDLRPVGQIAGLVVFAAWVVAIGLILWGPESRTLARRISGAAFVLTAALLVYAFTTGPRLSERTLLLSPAGLEVVEAACPELAGQPRIDARIALSQLDDQFVHVELIDGRCDRAGEDIRIRSEDLAGVLPR
jgi:hypothetical protein